VVGLFNLLESAFEGSGLEDDEMPRMPGDQFFLSVRTAAQRAIFSSANESSK